MDDKILWCMGFIDFALADCNFINIMKTNLLLWGVHDIVSPNPNSKCESFKDFWSIRNKWIPILNWFDHKKLTQYNLWICWNLKLVKLCRENLLSSYLPQPHELRLCSGGTYGSYGRAVTGFPAGIKIDPGWGLYLGLLTFE